MICSNCGTENEAQRKFCTECATPLAAACPNCGTTNPPTAKFCGECATPLEGVARPAEPISAPVAERRLVSVLFADLVGFTPFAEERDAEDVRETLTRYFELASEVLTRYGGTVEKFIGDAVMAVWGAPVSHEDDAERAVRAALELVDAVHSLGSGIQARAAVLTGEAAVTLGATNQGMVAGDLVNTASRLQSVAPPGDVLVGEATQRAASKAIVFEEAGEQGLKGKTSPVPAWRALRVVAEVGGRNRSEGLEAPFVGRNEEFRLLKELFHATDREKRARLVSVIGPAGIGKSRLAWEFLKYLDGIVGNVWWHNGRSPAYGEGITFWALGEMVRGRCGLAETDDEVATRAKVGTVLAEHVPDPAERSWIEPALLALLGIGSGSGSEQLFAAWRTFFERLGASGPVVLAFEDLHWADSGTLDFIDHLLEWSKGHPIYLVTLARPELIEKRPDWGAGKRNFASIYLEPLPEAAMRELLRGLVPGLPEAASRAIVARADGMPLYAVETIRMLVTDGRLTEEGGVYLPVGDLTALAVPESLTALIASRLDSLDPADRTLVQDAAVLGQSFTLEALSAVSGTDVVELEPRLRGLVRRELLTAEVDPRSPERGQYTFVQALIREVAYNTFAKKDRKLRHLAAARFFEQLGSDELAGALAGHYLAAYANAQEGPEAEALAVQARIALKGAAERAASLGAHDQAIAFLEQALTVTTDPTDEADLLERAGESAAVGARYGRAEVFLRRALALHRERSDRVATARASASLGTALIFGQQMEAALELLVPASAEFADLFPDRAVVRLDGMLARAYVENEEPRLGMEIAERVLEAAEHGDLGEILAGALLTKGMALGGLGRRREGIGVIRAGEQLARDNQLDDMLMLALGRRGFLQGDIDVVGGLDAYREGLAMARRVGSRIALLHFINNLGYTAFLAGDWDEALEQLDGQLAEDLERVDRIALLSNSVIVHACRGEDVTQELAELQRLMGEDPLRASAPPVDDAMANAALANGRLGDARTAWRHLADQDAVNAPEFRYRAARPAMWDGDVEAARTDLAALDATGVHGSVVELRRMTIRAGLTALEGRTADALALYRGALRGWRDLGLTWDEALTGIDMATLLEPSDPEVSTVAESSRQTLIRLGAKPFLQRLDAALARSTSAESPSTGAREPTESRSATPS
ncbi:MAG: AAA family ATPase [Chloroflexi bacterium]|nr:AAA family ATPase [Chloroflexota bacterium]